MSALQKKKVSKKSKAMKAWVQDKYKWFFFESITFFHYSLI